jgi:hypothetical protein
MPVAYECPKCGAGLVAIRGDRWFGFLVFLILTVSLSLPLFASGIPVPLRLTLGVLGVSAAGLALGRDGNIRSFTAKTQAGSAVSAPARFDQSDGRKAGD